MFDHELYRNIQGKYSPMSTAPIIEHPVVAVPGNRFYCLSTRADADGARAAALDLDPEFADAYAERGQLAEVA